MKKYKKLFFYAALFLLLFCIPMLAGTVFPYRSVLGFISPALLILITAGVYHRTGRTMNELGFWRLRSYTQYLPLGLLIGVALITITLMIQKIFLPFTIQWNEQINYVSMLTGLVAVLPGVLNEEFIFRGICYKELAGPNNSRNANILFGFLFMVWHWIAWNAWGNYPVMLGSVTTAIGHLLFSTALLRSGSIYFPIGMHAGINWAQQQLFNVKASQSASDTFQGMLIIDTTGTSPTLFHEIASPVISIGCFLGLYWWIRKKIKPKNSTIEL